MKFSATFLLTLILIAGANCRSSQIAVSEQANKYNGVTPLDGGGATLQKTTVIGVHLIFGIIPIYKADLDTALDRFTREARERGASKVRIVNTTKETGIWYLPPFTFFITPIFYDMTGEVYR
ncbi:MAG: hypothetical protein K8S54_17345 [Spirochaetia bacterium]|nr:hypothetical protein [Spirochaetia bacterium]